MTTYPATDLRKLGTITYEINGTKYPITNYNIQDYKKGTVTYEIDGNEYKKDALIQPEVLAGIPMQVKPVTEKTNTNHLHSKIRNKDKKIKKLKDEIEILNAKLVRYKFELYENSVSLGGKINDLVDANLNSHNHNILLIAKIEELNEKISKLDSWQLIQE